MYGDKPGSLHHAEDPVGGQRTLFTYDNQWPLKGNVEYGARLSFGENDEGRISGDARDTVVVQGDIRYGLLDDVTLEASIPLGFSDGDSSSSGGLGDISVGLALRAWEDILEAPYIIPHGKIFLPTGSESAGLGFGEFRARAGISAGDTVRNRAHVIGDLSYEFRTEVENAVILSGSSIIEASDRFGFVLEGRVANDESGNSRDRLDDDDDNEDFPADIGAGLYYDWDDNLRVSAHGVAGLNGNTDSLGMVRFTYQKIPDGTKSYDNIGMPMGLREDPAEDVRMKFPKAPPPPMGPGGDGGAYIGEEQQIDYGQGSTSAIGTSGGSAAPMATTYPVGGSTYSGGTSGGGGWTTVGGAGSYSSGSNDLPMATTYPAGGGSTYSSGSGSTYSSGGWGPGGGYSGSYSSPSAIGSQRSDLPMATTFPAGSMPTPPVYQR